MKQHVRVVTLMNRFGSMERLWGLYHERAAKRPVSVANTIAKLANSRHVRF